MQPLLERIRAGETILADGAMGTMLLARGLQPGECPEALSLSRPELLEDIARRYFDAGAEFLEANTFGASPAKLAFFGLDGRTEEINRAAVAAVRKVVGEHAYVAACIGPSGKILQPYGDTAPDEVYASYVRQLTVLVDAGIDAVCIETMIDLAEAQLAVKAAKSVAPALPVTASMTFDATPRGFYTVMGTTIAQAAEGLRAAGADVVGSNCGNGIVRMVEIAKAFRQATAGPLIFQANAGLPQTDGDQLIYAETPEYYAEQAQALLALGVAVLGGCCGTTPEHTRALRSLLGGVAHR
jgi:5-methyltetrahydrofolate--homocysteine methyltransferase